MNSSHQNLRAARQRLEATIKGLRRKTISPTREQFDVPSAFLSTHFHPPEDDRDRQLHLMGKGLTRFQPFESFYFHRPKSYEVVNRSSAEPTLTQRAGTTVRIDMPQVGVSKTDTAN